MEDNMYHRSIDDKRYVSRYEYSNLSQEAEVGQNYSDYPAEEAEEYPIGDSQDIDQSALPGDFYAEDEDCNYNVTKRFLQPTIPVKGALGGGPRQAHSGYGPRGALQSRPSAYFEVGDYRRTAIRDKMGHYKAESKAHTQQHGPDYALWKMKREAMLRNLSEKEYRNKLQKMFREDRMRHERMRQERHAAAKAKYYARENPDEQLTHDDLLANFKKNYQMDIRKPPEELAPKHLSVPMKVNNTKKDSPKSDTEAIREHYEEAYDRYYAAQTEKASVAPSGTKDTRSEPVQPDYNKFKKFLKSNKHRIYKEYSPRRPLTADDYAHAMLRNSAQKSHDLELKYKNDAYGKLIQEERDVLQDINENMNQQSSVTTLSHIKSSEEKMVPPRRNVSKIRNSARSSKKSNNTGRSKKYEDIVKLQKSKCTIMSVIFDGIQKCEQAKYEMPQMRMFKDENFLTRATKESQTGQNDKSHDSCTSTELMNSGIITHMFKEFRDYHLQNISQEVKRIQYLDVLPQKITNFQGPQ